MTTQEIKEIKNKITDDNIIDILVSNGANIYQNNDEFILTDTICHNGDKPKLYYYKQTKSFHCYTECGSFDIIELLCKTKGYTIYEAINWICVKYNIDNYQYGFGKPEIISDWDFINGFKKSKSKSNIINKDIVVYDDKIQNIFQKIYFEDWVKNGISISSMEKYNIAYCTFQQKIIIPHYNITNDLVGIRTRILLDDEITLYGKYSPFKLGEIIYKHPLSMNFYGINHNLQTIKNKQKVMLVEGEKAVLQADTLFNKNNFTLALSGCSLSTYQKNFLIMLGVKEVIIAFDRQYKELESEEALKWAEHLKKEIIKPLSPYMSVYVIWDTENLLDYKDSPLDKGKDILLKLMKNKIYVGSAE